MKFFEAIMLSELSHSQKDKYDSTYIKYLEELKPYR